MTWKKAVAWAWMLFCACCTCIIVWLTWYIIVRLLLGTLAVVAIVLAVRGVFAFSEWCWEQVT